VRLLEACSEVNVVKVLPVIVYMPLSVVDALVDCIGVLAAAVVA
jgi:hypothetical protein